MIITRIAYQGIDWDAYKNTGLDIEIFELQQTTLPMTESLEETTHKVMLNLENLPDNSNLSMSNKASIIRFVNGSLDQNLKGGFRLVELVDASRDSRRLSSASAQHQHQRLDDSITLPFLITVKGSSKHSDLALAFVMDVFLDHDNIAAELRTINLDIFKDVKVSASTWDDLTTEETIHPVQIKIDNLPDGYKVSPSIKASFLLFMPELLEDQLDNSI